MKVALLKVSQGQVAYVGVIVIAQMALCVVGSYS